MQYKKISCTIYFEKINAKILNAKVKNIKNSGGFKGDKNKKATKSKKVINWA